jgi:transposase
LNQGVAKFRRGIKKTPPNPEAPRTCAAGLFGRKRFLASSKAPSRLGVVRNAASSSNYESASQATHLFGWVEPLYRWHGLLRWPKGNRQGFLAFLKYLCTRIKGWKVYLYVDGASWHKGKEVRGFLSQHPEIEMEYLPFCHPELNVQERIWRHIWYTVTPNRYLPTMDLLERAIPSAQCRWNPDKIRHLYKSYLMSLL